MIHTTKISNPVVMAALPLALRTWLPESKAERAPQHPLVPKDVGGGAPIGV